MRKNFYDEEWQVAELKGRQCLFSDVRIDRASIPAGSQLYELADDCDGVPCRMRPRILVNFFGTIITGEQFEADEGEKDTVWLAQDDFWYHGKYIDGEEAERWLASALAESQGV